MTNLARNIIVFLEERGAAIVGITLATEVGEAIQVFVGGFL